MLIGNASLCVSVLLFTFFNSLTLIYLASIFLGISNAMNMIGRLSYITDITRSNERGRAISVMAGCQRCGSLLGPLLFSIIAKQLSYQITFSVMAILVGLNLVTVFIYTEAFPSHHRKDSPLSAMLHIIMDFRPILFTAGYAGLTLMMLRSARSLLFPLFGYRYGLDVAEIGFLFSVSSAVDMCMFYPAGQIMDR